MSPLASRSHLRVAMSATHEHSFHRPTGLIVAFEPRVNGPLRRLAQRSRWTCLIQPPAKQVLSRIREGTRLVVIQVTRGGRWERAVGLIETLHGYWVPCAVVGALTGGGMELERRVRQAGATCLVGPPVREPALGRAIDALSGVGRWHPGRGLPDAEDDHPPREGRGRPPPASDFRGVRG